MSARTSARRLVQWTGICSILTGTLYLPWLPWYVLGGELEAEITQWGRLSVWGGAAALAGSLLLYSRDRSLVRLASAVGLVGMVLFFLAQVLSILWWILSWGQPITEGGVENPTYGNPLNAIPHAAIAVLSLSGFRALIRTGRE